ncbi:long-chain fatty acid--CoA ligase [Pedomonas sp. V897]|uniref:long-chain fatty acid--CoA ligase n=1 Tax=Pedomonas sp. V897 TaxID=3446482 RepID=UPI003EE08111
MSGRMQDWPLLIWRLIEHAAIAHGGQEIVTATVEGERHRYTWADCRHRARQLAEALTRLGVRTGDRVGSLAWNTHRHLEAWFAVSGMGAVMHTINPRLFAEQLVYIINHAEDTVLMLDLSFVPLVEKLAPRLTTVKTYILLTDRAHMPETSLPNVLCYEELLAAEPGAFRWPEMDETTPAGLCYTSGTTGNPKGVLYTHRSTVLHTLLISLADTMGLTSSGITMPVVPMFHANAWGVPYSAAAVGAKLVLNGPNFDPATLQRLIIEEGVTSTAAVPTIWLGMLQHLEKTGTDLGPLERLVIGGAAAPRVMIETFENRYGIKVFHAWGMTEMSPVGTVGSLTAAAEKLPQEQQIDLKCKQGRAIFGVDLKVTDDAGNTLPRDGRTAGHLKVRGPAVVARYFKDEGGDILDEESFFDTGDVATIDEMGFIQITDRAKDVIKSGGEWISSIDLENAAVGHPAVAEAAVIGVPHPKWDERPLLIVVRKPGETVGKEDLLAFLQGKVAKWWLPDDVVFVDEIPHTATGKISKLELRRQFKDYKLPTAA